ncbi:glycoside hydrolase family 28 protein [Pseudochryseolinea flava]|uniref:Glycoside hydrolase family 28 protein n=1 Tax=Pseudochryseolinea flava TaxID=2059302 RepID=A0A364Y070_9BACT|nr:glycoside hydrolase family 28 protein [Pseudochryseolinea flava]RAW00045.1 glycoside hydrolase family 28 protein [Pseudochryseolinea flava]
MMMMKHVLVFFLFTFSVASAQEIVYKDLPFAMSPVTAPVFPDRKSSVTDFGAVGDGVTVNTAAFNSAIETLANKGGGTLLIPRGIWLTGPITLKSNINLHTEAGALIIFTKNMDDYPLVETSFEGLNTTRCLSPINGKDLTNIAITGAGVFDGSGDAWRHVKKSKLTGDQWKKLVASGGVLNEAGNTWYPTEKAKKGALLTANFNVPDLKTNEELEAIKDFLRPVMVSIVKCKNVLLDGPTFQNSPAWCLHPLMSENIIIRNLTVRNPWYSQNGDGLDLESCSNVIIDNCSFDVGDDAICIKSGKDKDGRARAMPTQNVVVNNCVVYHGHGGFVVGSEMSGGVRNIKVQHCTFIGTDVGLRFKSTRGRGGVVEKIFIEDINMIDIPAEALLFDLYYSGNSPVPTVEEKFEDKEKLAKLLPAVTEETPSFRDITINNVQCRGAGRAMFMQGLPEMNLKNIKVSNVKIVSTKGIEVTEADGIVFDNISIQPEVGAALALKNTKNISFTNFVPVKQNAVTISGVNTQNVRLEKNNIAVTVSEEVNKKAVTLK